MDSISLKNEIVKLCESVKALDLEVYDYSKYYYETDFMIVCSGTSTAHNNGIAEKVEVGLKKFKQFAHSVEGKEEKNWILLDYETVVLHLFEMDRRREVDIDELLSERFSHLTTKKLSNKPLSAHSK